MVWKIIIIISILSYISMHWNEKIEKNRTEKRKYRFLMGLTYLATSIVSFFVVKYFGNVIYLYTILGIIFSIGSVLSAINPNLRNIYTCILTYGFIAWIISFYFNNHKIIFSIIDILLVCFSIICIKEGILNIRNGIDPDIIEEQKRREKEDKRREKKYERVFTLARILFHVWRW